MKARITRKAIENSGSTFDNFLEQEGIREEVEAITLKRVLAWQIGKAIEESKLRRDD
jgi:antitoxin HicB